MDPDTPNASPVRRSFRFADLRGAVQLSAQATVGLADLSEGVHRNVVDTIGLPPHPAAGRTRGLTGFVYRAVRGIARASGGGVGGALGWLESRLPDSLDAGQESHSRVRILGALNGVLGDRLAADRNPLALAMSFRAPGGASLWTDLEARPPGGGKILLLIHGLCLSDLAWQGQETNLGDEAARALGFAPIYLRYNSGLHVSQNGLDLSRALENLVARWPRPAQGLAVVAHSMGGLVIRGALEQARTLGHRWPDLLESLVFLGTPHHGAPLEKIGSQVDAILGASRWTAPFSSLVRIRSAGITDLRHGNVREEDWRGRDRFLHRRDCREVLPLPEGVACHAVAASLAVCDQLVRDHPVRDHLVGDGLVALPSALGEHRDPRRTLTFDEDRRRTFDATGHNELMTKPEVIEQVLAWLRDSRRP